MLRVADAAKSRWFCERLLGWEVVSEEPLTLGSPGGAAVQLTEPGATGGAYTLLEPRRLTDAEIVAVYQEGGRRVAARPIGTDLQLFDLTRRHVAGLEQIPCQLQPGGVRLTGHPTVGG